MESVRGEKCLLESFVLCGRTFTKAEGSEDIEKLGNRLVELNTDGDCDYAIFDCDEPFSEDSEGDPKIVVVKVDYCTSVISIDGFIRTQEELEDILNPSDDQEEG